MTAAGTAAAAAGTATGVGVAAPSQVVRSHHTRPGLVDGVRARNGFQNHRHGLMGRWGWKSVFRYFACTKKKQAKRGEGRTNAEKKEKMTEWRANGERRTPQNNNDDDTQANTKANDMRHRRRF